MEKINTNHFRVTDVAPTEFDKEGNWTDPKGIEYSGEQIEIEYDSDKRIVDIYLMAEGDKIKEFDMLGNFECEHKFEVKT